MDKRFEFFHAPRTRSNSVRLLVEELGADYEMHVLNLKKGEQRQPAHLAVNPLGKVPAIRHRGQVITEQGAIFLYLSDLYAEAGLTPAIDDPLRGPFLRWLFFYGSSFEPAVVDKAMKRDAPPPMMSPYGDFDSVIGAVTAQITPGPFLLGQRFTSADILWGASLKWIVGFGIVPATPAVTAYVDRVFDRPAIKRAAAADDELAQSQEAETVS